MFVLTSGRRAVARYGWKKAARKAPAALRRRARKAYARRPVMRSTSGEAVEPRIQAAAAQAGVDPTSLYAVVDVAFGTQLVRKKTTDWPTYNQVFLREDYKYDYGFTPTTFVDLGANVGYSVVYHARRYPGCRMVAVEPDEANARMARANIALGCGQPIDVLQSGIWHRPARLRITNPGANAWAIRVAEASADDPNGFDAVTMTQIMERCRFDIVDLVKIDIEAGERFLFAQNTEWLERVNAMVIELHDRHTPGCREPVEAALRKHFGDYTEKTLGENTFFVRRDLIAG